MLTTRQLRIPAAVSTLLLGGMVAAGLVANSTPPAEAGSVEDQEFVTVEWLGGQLFRFTSPRGVVVLTSPDLRDGPISLEQIDRADIILVPNSHNDDMGQPVPIAARTGATVLAPAPLGRWLVEQGLDQRQLMRAATGDTREVEGIWIKVLPNPHDNTLRTGADGGPAVSYMIRFENGFTAYFFSHSTITMDMQLYGLLYQPHMVLLTVSSTVSDPLEFAHSVRLLSTDNPNLPHGYPAAFSTRRPGHRAGEDGDGAPGLGRPHVRAGDRGAVPVLKGAIPLYPGVQTEGVPIPLGRDDSEQAGEQFSYRAGEAGEQGRL